MWKGEAKQKVEKHGLTMDKLNNPQSACGNACVIAFSLCYMIFFLCGMVGDE